MDYNKTLARKGTFLNYSNIYMYGAEKNLLFLVKRVLRAQA